MGEAEVAPADDKPVETGTCTADESVVWSQEVEVCLFHAMLGHKPVGKLLIFVFKFCLLFCPYWLGLESTVSSVVCSVAQQTLAASKHF